MTYLAGMEILLPWQPEDCAIIQLYESTVTQQNHSILVQIWYKCSLSQCILTDKLGAMETLFSWQEANCAITQFHESILS